MYVQTMDRLRLACLNEEQHRGTCRYWYVLTSRSGPFTAFRTRAALEFFLDLHGLTLAEPLPEERGTHASIQVHGSCRFASHMSMDDMPKSGKRVLYLSNARYTLGVMSEAGDGPALHFVNVNCDRPEFDYRMAEEHVDAGHRGPMSALLAA